jgi:uncharacterized protein YraI
MRLPLRPLLLALCAALTLAFSPGGAPAAGQQGRASAARVVPCDVRAYVNDPDPKGLNVRSGPGTQYVVVGNLPDQQAEGIEVHITGSSGDWVRIDRAVEQGGDGERNFFRGTGWVYAPSLGVEGVGGLTPPGTPLYAGPAKGKPSARLSVDDGGKVRGCRGRWTQIEFKGRRLWAAPGTLCYSALTTCS